MSKISLIVPSLVLWLLALLPATSQSRESPYLQLHGAIVRGDRSQSELALVFTGDEYADGALHIDSVLRQIEVKVSFFLTGKFYRNPLFAPAIKSLKSSGHYMGAHSDQHLLYCDWTNRDSLLVSREEFSEDIMKNYDAMHAFGVDPDDASYLLPPYEWYNDSIAHWSSSMGIQLVNMTYGTLSHADYTVPGAKNYHSSAEIFQSILEYEISSPHGLNGFILLIHIGTVPERTDKFYFYLERLILELQSRGYCFKRIDELLDKIQK